MKGVSMFHAISFDKMKDKFRKKNGSFVCVVLTRGLGEPVVYYVTTDDWFVFWLWLYRYNRDFYDVIPDYKDQCIYVKISDCSLYDVSQEILDRHTKTKSK